MANSLTPTDVYSIVNAAAKEMMGTQATVQAVNTSTFITVGAKMLAAGYENTLNALSLVLARTIVAVRPYRGKFGMIYKTAEEYGMFTRKISYYYDGNEQSTNFNTNLKTDQLKDGNSVDHYNIRKRYPLEIVFGGAKLIQKHYSRFLNQLKMAFQSEADFAKFYEGLAVEVQNELELNVEAENRLMVLNHIAGIYNTGTPGMKVNLTAGFNEKFGTTYTTDQLLTEHFTEFLEYFVSTVQYTSDMLTEFNELFHLSPAKTNDAGENLILPRHTPKDMQRLFLLSPFMIDAKARVLPEIFNPKYLSIDNYEPVNYWQNPNDPGAINITPNQLNVTTGQSEDGDAVSLKYVVGILFDRDALLTATRIDQVLTTPVNAAGAYYNTFYHWLKDYRADFTENAVIFYMEDATN